MASRFPPNNRAQLRARKGHDMTWSCDKHAEPIAFYCKKHDISVCHRCATKNHGNKPCGLDDIEDIIFERRRKLDEKQHEIEKTKKELKTRDYKIESIATFSSNHLQIVNGEVQSTYKAKSKIVKDDGEKKIRLINEEADKEIRIINEKRDRRIKAYSAEIQKQQLIIEESQAKLISETKAISEEVSQKIEDLKIKNQDAISSVENIDSNIKRIKQNDKTLVNEALQVLASLDDNLNCNVRQDVMDCLDRIQHEVQRVEFVEGEVGGAHYGRIDGYIGKWELVKSIQVQSTVNEPLMRGLISDDEICVQNISDNATYVTNTSTEHTQKVIEGEGTMGVTSCAPIDSNVIVCGRWRVGKEGDNLDGYITLYDRNWEVIRDISISKNNHCTVKVCVDVDRDGMILAAQFDQSNIYVINPADGKIVSTITMQGKKVNGKIQALSSGDIVMKTACNKFTVISRSGEEKAVIHCDEWRFSRCRVDKLTDTLYITYQDGERTFVAIDQVSCDGIIQASRIVEYKKPYPNSYLYTTPCLITHNGNLVACDRDKLFLYKKRFFV